MRAVIIKLHCTELECGNCAHHTNIAHRWVSTPWCAAFRTYIEDGKRSHYCLTSERELSGMYARLLRYSHTTAPLDEFYRVCSELEKCQKLLKELQNAQEG